jgi:hypothetical protein
MIPNWIWAKGKMNESLPLIEWKNRRVLAVALRAAETEFSI